MERIVAQASDLSLYCDIFFGHSFVSRLTMLN